MKHPYELAPDSAFWSRSVSKNFMPASVIGGRTISANESVMSAGSCFAANIVPFLRSAGIRYVRTEDSPRYFTVPPEHLGYDKFSAAYGNIYTARQMLQLIQRATSKFEPQEQFWIEPPFIVDPYRPGLRYKARSEREFRTLTEQHLQAVVSAVRQADVFIFTLGLTEAWVSSDDGAIFPACPGTIAGNFDPQRHRFINFSAQDVKEDLCQLVDLTRDIQPNLRFILTVSPVPLVATATNRHVLEATVYSKSVLRVAAEEAVGARDGVTYFPAYEIITGPQAPFDSFQPDRRSVSPAAIETVMNAFLVKSTESDASRPILGDSLGTQFASALADLECEEAAADYR